MARRRDLFVRPRAGSVRRRLVPYRRALRFEPLEDRRLLSVYLVMTDGDTAGLSPTGGTGTEESPFQIATLRSAVEQANAIAGADTIMFDAALSGETISLGATELAIAEALTIDARPLAANVTIDANELSRIFNFTASTGDLTLAGLTLTAGRTTGNNQLIGGFPGPVTNTFHGGAVRFISSGTLAIANSLISGSRTEGIFAFGGAVFTAGNLVLDQSTISGNETRGVYAFGGGVSALGNLTITGSTVTNNHAGTSGQAGIVTSGNLTIRGSIIAGNTAAGLPRDVTNFGSTPTVDYSLIGDTFGSGITTTTGSGNVLDQPALLGPLGDTGGATKTHLLLPGSPAIDAGDPDLAAGVGDTPLYDQRGDPYTRVSNGRIDMGAVESQPIPLAIVVDSVADGSDGVKLTLREAINLANNIPGDDSISFDDSLSGGTILLTLGELAIQSSVTIDGPGAELLTIRTYDPTPVMHNGDGSRIFHIDDGTGGLIDVVISGLTLTGGDVSGNGGAIFTRENLTLTNAILTGNRAFHGGGIYNASGTTEVVNSTMSGNTGSSRGGGVYSKSITNVVGSTLSGNRSTYGGGIYNALGGALGVANSTISGNFADNGGGGIDNHGNANFSHITVTENGTYLFGAGVRGYGTTTLDHTIVTGNLQDTSQSNLYGGSFSGDYNLVGTVSSISGAGNIASDSPGLGPLANNGGPTKTHALLPGSPAVDAGDPDFDPDDFDPLLIYDQRGAPFVRVHGGRIDVGAFELQPAGPALPGDYNLDGVVDAADYTVWRDTLGTGGLMPYEGADGSGNGVIGPEDYLIWKSQYGQTLPGAGSGSIASVLQWDPAAETGQQSARPQSSAAGLRQTTRAAAPTVFHSELPSAASTRHGALSGRRGTGSGEGGRYDVPIRTSVRQDSGLLAWLSAQSTVHVEDRNELDESGKEWAAYDEDRYRDAADWFFDALSTMIPERVAVRA